VKPWSSWPHVYALVDIDAFYVSAELRRRPELRGKPVIVAWRGPRAVVTTASYEARRFGVGSAMPVARARRLCPQGVYLPPDMAHYRARSRELMSLIAELEVPVEPVSLDEAYLDLSSVAYPIDAMSGLVGRIDAELGLTASVGIGPSKLVAKVASAAEKPRGFVVLSREQAAARFADESPRMIPGIGPRTTERLAALGIETIAALQARPLADLTARFGERLGRSLVDRAHFRDGGRVATRVAKSRSVEATFDTDVDDRAQLERILAEQARRLGAGVRTRGVRGRTIGIKVRLDDFSTSTRARTLPEPTDDPDLIAATALALLAANPPSRPVRLLGVRLASFEDEGDGGAAPPTVLQLPVGV
jgi:DNA polymerase-4